MIVQADKFTFTAHKYLLDLQSFREERNSMRMDAVWFTRTKGQIAIHSGVIVDMRNKCRTIDDFFQRSDIYTPGSHFKWNGTEMWSDRNHFLPEMEAYKKLNPIRELFPRIPEQYTGWFAFVP